MPRKETIEDFEPTKGLANLNLQIANSSTNPAKECCYCHAIYEGGSKPHSHGICPACLPTVKERQDAEIRKIKVDRFALQARTNLRLAIAALGKCLEIEPNAATEGMQNSLAENLDLLEEWMTEDLQISNADLEKEDRKAGFPGMKEVRNDDGE